MPDKQCRCQQAPNRRYTPDAGDALDRFDDGLDLRLPFATAFVRPQVAIYDMFGPAEALAKGTCFPELYQPYPCYRR